MRAKRDRLVEAMFAAYAAKGLSEPFAVIVAAHLQMQAVRGVAAAPIDDSWQWPRPAAPE